MSRAFVECNVVVVDCATGRQIGAVHDPTNLWASGSPPKRSPADLLRLAEEDQIKPLVEKR